MYTVGRTGLDFTAAQCLLTHNSLTLTSGMQTESGTETEPLCRVPTGGSADGTEYVDLKRLLFFKVYKRRWFVLLVLCLLNCSNATVSDER